MEELEVNKNKGKCYYKDCDSEDVFPLKINARNDNIEILICKKHYYIFIDKLLKLNK